MEYNSVYSFPVFGNCFVLLRKWMCNRITKIITGQDVGYCKNVGKMGTCYKYCFYPQDWFLLLLKTVYFALWAILVIDATSGEYFSRGKEGAVNKAVTRGFSMCNNNLEKYRYADLSSLFFIFFLNLFSCSPVYRVTYGKQVRLTWWQSMTKLLLISLW